MDYLGNTELLAMQKTAFLASSTMAPDVVLCCYDWATGEHEGCVVSGFSSKLEQDVLHFLLKGKTPVIMVLARRMYRELHLRISRLYHDGRRDRRQQSLRVAKGVWG